MHHRNATGPDTFRVQASKVEQKNSTNTKHRKDKMGCKEDICEALTGHLFPAPSSRSRSIPSQPYFSGHSATLSAMASAASLEVSQFHGFCLTE